MIYHNFGFIKEFFLGWLGVDLFFVLSGFLITDILLKTTFTKKHLKNFYIRRILRIFPLYYLFVIVCLFIIPQFSSHFKVEYYKENQVWFWTYFQNWLYIFKPINGHNPLHHLWSLAVEEQFYLIWPIIILLIKKPTYLFLFISLVLLSVLGLRFWIWTHQLADLAYYNLYTFSRIDGICIGCMIALLQKINTHFLKKYTPGIVLFFAGLNFAFFFFNRQFDFSFPYLAIVGYTTFAMIFGLLINDVVTGNTVIINKLLSIRILHFFGKISYGFYIFHWPLYLLLNPVLYQILMGKLEGYSLNFIVSFLATLAAVILSWLSYRYFESYFLRLKEKYAS